MTLTVDTRYVARRPWAPRAAQFARWAGTALGRVGRPTLLSIVVVGTKRSRSLNRDYRGKDRATNVLSFAGAGPGPDGRVDLGELVLCAPVVALEARGARKSAESHWAHLVVHGVLHLTGHDHEGRAEAARMAAREVQILEKLGYSDPYL